MCNELRMARDIAHNIHRFRCQFDDRDRTVPFATWTHVMHLLHTFLNKCNPILTPSPAFIPMSVGLSQHSLAATDILLEAVCSKWDVDNNNGDTSKDTDDVIRTFIDLARSGGVNADYKTFTQYFRDVILMQNELSDSTMDNVLQLHTLLYKQQRTGLLLYTWNVLDPFAAPLAQMLFLRTVILPDIVTNIQRVIMSAHLMTSAMFDETHRVLDTQRDWYAMTEGGATSIDEKICNLRSCIVDSFSTCGALDFGHHCDVTEEQMSCQTTMFLHSILTIPVWLQSITHAWNRSVLIRRLQHIINNPTTTTSNVSATRQKHKKARMKQTEQLTQADLKGIQPTQSMAPPLLMLCSIRIAHVEWRWGNMSHISSIAKQYISNDTHHVA